jgi:prepilin-type N-terminal cleavage/methylation domain-containing protein
MKTHSSTFRRGFTLVEMLAVITIIVILAALTIGGMGYVREKQARSQATVQIKLLENAIEEYKQDTGHYPYGGNAAKGDSNILFKALYFDSDEHGAGPEADLEQKIYLSDLDPTLNKQKWIDDKKANSRILDPWGNEYYFRSGKTEDGKANAGAVNPDFDIWSAGPDGKTSKGADNNDTKDDIRNF